MREGARGAPLQAFQPMRVLPCLLLPALIEGVVSENQDWAFWSLLSPLVTCPSPGSFLTPKRREALPGQVVSTVSSEVVSRGWMSTC